MPVSGDTSPGCSRAGCRPSGSRGPGKAPLPPLPPRPLSADSRIPFTTTDRPTETYLEHFAQDHRTATGPTADRRRSAGHERLLLARLRLEGQWHGRRRHGAGARQLRRRQQPCQHGLGRFAHGHGPDLVPADTRRRTQWRPDAHAQWPRRERPGKLVDARIGLQQDDQPRPVAGRLGLRQRRHEHHLSAGQFQLRRRRRQPAVRQWNPGREHDATGCCTDRFVQAQ